MFNCLVGIFLRVYPARLCSEADIIAEKRALYQEEALSRRTVAPALLEVEVTAAVACIQVTPRVANPGRMCSPPLQNLDGVGVTPMYLFVSPF